jgi:hypothetical protein
MTTNDPLLPAPPDQFGRAVAAACRPAPTS